MAGSSMFASLPQEIKLMICTQLESDGPGDWHILQSLTALRLTCKAWASLPVLKIYRIAKLYPSWESLRALESIALRPEYGALIETLDLRSQYIPVYKDRSESLDKVSKHSHAADGEIPLLQGLAHLRDQCKLCNLEEHYNAYLQHLSDQRIFQEMGLVYLSLQIISHLTKLPNLKRLDFSTLSSFPRWEGRKLTKLEKETLLTREAGNVQYERDHVRMLKVLFSVLISKNIRLQILAMHQPSMDFFTHESWMAYWGWSKEEQEWNRPITSNVFSTVEHLQLNSIPMPAEAENRNVPGDDGDEDADSTGDDSNGGSITSDDDDDTESTSSDWDHKEEALGHFIIAFPNLKSLVLSFDRTCSPIVLECLSGSENRWSSLVCLHLVNMKTTQDDFFQLLEAHKRSLRYLYMLGIALLEGRWVPIFHVMSTVLMLEATNFNCLWDIQPYFIWRVKVPPTEECLLSRLLRSIIRKDEAFPLPLSDEQDDAFEAWSRISDASLAYEPIINNGPDAQPA